MKFSKGVVANVYNIKLKEGVDMEAPELIQVTVGETICNSSADSDSDASDYDDKIELVAILCELDEYISKNHSYILSYDWAISSYVPDKE